MHESEKFISFFSLWLWPIIWSKS